MNKSLVNKGIVERFTVAIALYKTIKLCYNMNNMSSKYLELINRYFSRINIPHNNKEVFFLSLVLLFAILARVLPFALISLIFVICVLFVVGFDFYLYSNKKARDENKNEITTEFSWGFVKEKADFLDLQTLFKYLTSKDFSFYKSYLKINTDRIVVVLFLFGDLIIAFKNLDMFNSGIYIAMSIFTKFVFIGYMFMRQSHMKYLVGDKDTEENVLDIFYTQMNTMLSVFVVVFIAFFMLSKFLVEVFYGKAYLPYHSSLPFVLLANMFLVIALCVFLTARKIDAVATDRILKVYALLFGVLFVFMTINYIDTVTYFIVGSAALLSIFLYNFVIKKPQYISDTYNHLF